MENRFVRINYDERGDISSYEGIEITLLGGEVVQDFDSGDVVKDFEAMVTWLEQNPLDPAKGRTMFTSSVDHFCMDVAGYKWTVDERGRDLIAAMTPEEVAEYEADIAEMAAEETAEKAAAKPVP